MEYIDLRHDAILEKHSLPFEELTHVRDNIFFVDERLTLRNHPTKRILKEYGHKVANVILS